jgi:hypothetical protein
MTRKIHCSLFVLLAAAFYPVAARADLIISASAFPVAPGSHGSFDVRLSSTGTETALISSFSFDILAASPGISVTGASVTTSAAPYIYAGDSFAEVNGFPLATKTGEELIASDTPNSGVAKLITSSTPVSLGEVFFSIAPSAVPGPAFTFSIAGTSLSDQFGNPLTFSTIIIPEPAPVSLLLPCLGLIVLTRQRRGMPDRRR